jgi:tetratricopeptide (TPR) repeat protein
MTLMNLGVAAMEAGEQERAIGYLQEALDLHRRTGNRDNQALVHTNLGRLRMIIGDAEGALAEGLAAERLYRENPTADPRQGQAKENLSEAYLKLGDIAAARREIEDAVRIRIEFFDRRGLAGSLRQAGHVHRAEGDFAAARKAWREAAEILEEFADPASAELAELIEELPPGP